MSWLTQFARAIGLGGVLDAVEAAEAKPTPGTIATALGVTAVAAASAPKLSTVAVTDLGAIAQTAITGAAAAVLPPGTATIAADVAGSLIGDIEQLVISRLTPPQPVAQAQEQTSG